MDEWSWECNECGSNEFSGGISEDDLENLACSNCGANEFHKSLPVLTLTSVERTVKGETKNG